jgi:predicted methyltransferase
MNDMSTVNKEARSRQRYRHIKLVADTMGFTIRDMHREFNAAESAKPNGQPVSFQQFYRVAAGQRTSARIRSFISRKIKTPNQELWA